MCTHKSQYSIIRFQLANLIKYPTDQGSHKLGRFLDKAVISLERTIFQTTGVGQVKLWLKLSMKKWAGEEERLQDSEGIGIVAVSFKEKVEQAIES